MNGNGVLDVERIRRDFPILERVINGHPLVYLDSAATSQKPRQVIDAVSDFYANHNANAHRGIYTLGEESTEAFEGARAKLARFFGAPDPRTIVFTRGTTESLNLVAQGWGRKFLKEGDEVLLTDMEHHSNIVPWQLTAQVTGAVLRYIPLTDDGQLDLSELGSLAQRADQDPVGDRDVQRPGDDHAARPARSRPRTRWARSSRWTPRSSSRTTASPSPSWTATSSRSAATRCWGRRRAAGSTRRPSSSRRWIRCSAAAR